MTVSINDTLSGPYAGNNVTDTFEYNFKIEDKSELLVYTTAGESFTYLAVDTDYTVTGVGEEPGGSITLTAGALATGSNLYVESDYNITQETPFASQGSFFPLKHERALDKLTRIALQLKRNLLDRVGFNSNDNRTGKSNELPLPEENKVLAWSNGNLVNERIVDIAPGLSLVGNVLSASTLSAMKAAPITSEIIYVQGRTNPQDGYEGNFQWRTGDYTAQAALDTTEAIIVKHNDYALTVGARVRDYSVVKVSWFDYKTTNTAAQNGAALNAAIIFTNRVLDLGDIDVSFSQVTLKSNICIKGSGTLTLGDGLNSDGFTGNVSNVEINGIVLNGNKANNPTGGSAVNLLGASSRIKIFNCRLTDWKYAGLAAVSGASEIDIILSEVDNNDLDGLQYTSVGQIRELMCNIHDNGRFGSVKGTSCTDFMSLGSKYKNNAGGGSIMVGGNDAIHIGSIADNNGTGHGLQYNTVTRGAYIGNISKNNGISGFDHYNSGYGLSCGNISYGNDVRGFEIDSVSLYNVNAANISYQNGGAGISVYRSPTAIVALNQALENGNITASEAFGIRLWDDINTLTSNSCLIIGNGAHDDRGASSTQLYGLSIEGANTRFTVVDANRLATNKNGPVSAVNDSIERARDNQGWTTQAEGTATILTGTTSIVVNHGLSVTPAAENFIFTLTNNPTTNPQGFYVTNITGTQFTINCFVDPGASGAIVGWRVSRY
jgi:hypothetical protein